jgi:dihydrodipicolinate synthase/N-acetylneuraminate lyase
VDKWEGEKTAMNLAEIQARRQPGRAVTGMAAVLLPFTAGGQIAEDAYIDCLSDTVKAGLTPAVNMDTGYVNLLTDREKERVLRLARQALGNTAFVAGAYIEGQDGDVAELYRREIGRIAEHGGTPILFQTSRLHNRPAAEVVATYARAVADVPAAYGFELGRMFAPNGEIWTADVAEGIMSIPQIKGMKHSSLDRAIELERLVLRDRVRPDFKIFTGNDLGIDMIEYGSDYLLGLAAFSPSKFAERDRLWRNQDTGYLAIADALQFLGNIAFRPPVPAYKHSAAIFLNLLGKIPTDKTHPRSPGRPPWEREILASCAERLGLSEP